MDAEIQESASRGGTELKILLEVLTAVKKGDFKARMPLDWTGVEGKIADTLNDIIELNDKVSRAIGRAGELVGRDGKLAERVSVGDLDGAWAHEIEAVNGLISDLARPTTEMARVIGAVAKGDLTQRMVLEADGMPLKGEFLRTSKIVNTMVDQLGSFASEVTRVAREVGTEGKLGGQALVPGVAGTWKDLTENVNSMAGNLTGQVRNIAEVTTAVANGNLTKKITADAKGEILELKNTINTMVDQLGSFASEVTRVAREVGTEGKLGGQAQVPGVSGTWKGLTDNVNLMASNLTDQVRGIARVVTAVANGDLKKKLTVEAEGEIAALTDTINNLIDTLAIFTDQVTGVAREVGVEGKLGGQARVPGASGTWRDLTDNVNQLAANLTTQVRAIAEVATAVTKGDLTREIGVAAEGEVAVLKDNINEMIRNLKDTTDKNTEQDWLKTNLARFTRMLQGQREIMTVYKLILSELAPLVNASHGVFYGMQQVENEEPRLSLQASYAYKERKNLSKHFKLGEGLIGECALEKERILLTNVPSDYVQISSGLGHATPLNIVVLPVMFEGDTKAVIELASFQRFSPTHLTFLEQLTESIGIVLNSIEVNSRTEALLQQSQKMAMALQNQQEELQQTNEELEQKARLLADQNAAVERKNQEVEIAKRSLEEKAAQLSLTSKYKSEFLANMSHELRTPLNSLLLLSQQLQENPDQNLTERQVEYAATIFASGNDLLNLINDILDLSKIESGTVTADIGELKLDELRNFVEQTFRHIAEDKKLGFSIEIENGLPPAILTDERRVKQILKNLLSNAFKFTAEGQVGMKISRAIEGWNPANPSLNNAERVIAFTVTDSGIGIAADKQRVIFEAFQQADGTTSRKYGGTGLGLAISRELARLLGGEITVYSVEGQGTVFTVYLPDRFMTSTMVSDYFPEPDASILPQPVVTEERRYKKRASKPSMFAPTLLVPEPIQDDRATIQPGDRVILIIEDEQPVAAMLQDFAHDRGFKTLVATQGQAALTLAREYRPDAITLDIQLPDMSGWAILDKLKHEPITRHIPVHVISENGEDERSRKLGALAGIQKPVVKEALGQSFARIEEFLAHKVKNVLVVEDQPLECKRIVELISNSDVNISTAATGSEALAALKQSQFDCLVLDLGLQDTTGFEVIEEIKKDVGLRSLPIIVYTARDLTRDEEARLKKVVKSIIVKDVRSLDRLLDEVTLFLHQVESDLPEFKRKILEQIRKTDPMLADKKVLIVDDDVRNIFSLTAVLERHRMQVLSAENGKSAIALLKKNPGIDIVLMDVMMPEMDGYETMRAIRKLPKFKALPIISLTAKAMKGDREKCIEAGASDYITKPVNTEQLLSLLRVWLYR